MRGNKNGVRADFKRDLQKVMAGKAQYRPAVRVQVSHQFEPVCKRFRCLDRREKNHIMHFADFTVLLVDRADFT